jgi:hypothetical protein
MTQHPYEEIEAFALGSLGDAEQRAVLDHADACSTCAVVLSDAMAGVAALAALEEPRPMGRSLTLPAAPVVARRRIGTPAWLATGALAACFALLFWNVRLRDDALTVPVAALVHSHFVHHPLTGGAGASGSAKVLQAQDGRWIYVVADGLAPRGTYTVWETRSGTTQEVAHMTADGHGQAARYIEQPQGTIDAVVLSPAGKTITDVDALHWP